MSGGIMIIEMDGRTVLLRYESGKKERKKALFAGMRGVVVLFLFHTLFLFS
jgi:hypothetical protein